MQNKYVSKENIIEQIVKKSKEKRESKSEDKELKMLIDDLKEVEDKLGSISEAVRKVFKNIEKKDREINRLESRLSQNSQDFAIEEENKRIRRRIAKLESILSDYGLIWIGDAAFRESSSNLEIRKIQTGYVPNIERVKTSAEQLSNNAELRKKKSDDIENCAIIDLTLYKDGIVVEKGPFRKYGTPSATQFLQDIEEGYYPTELKEKYPEGVVFKVQDKRTLTFEEDSDKPGNVFIGKGQRLGEASPKPPSIAKSDVVETASRRKISRESRRETSKPVENQVVNDESPVSRRSVAGGSEKKPSAERKSIQERNEGKIVREKRRASSKVTEDGAVGGKRRKSSVKNKNKKQRESEIKDLKTSPT